MRHHLSRPPAGALGRACLPLALFLTALILVLPSLSIQDGSVGAKMLPDGSSNSISPQPNGNLHPGLARALGQADPDASVESLVRFQGAISLDDRDQVARLGIQWRDELNSLPVALLAGTPDQLMELTRYDRVVWMEHNQPVTPIEPLMEQSLRTIDATSNWYSRTLDVHGREIATSPDLQSQAISIDGRGVTVAVIDTGTDAGHPDLDYLEKVRFNKWCNLADPNDQDSTCVWVEEENTDHSYGHGTHVAGTIAGNGDASAGERRGVAPGADLVELGGDWLGAIWAVAHALDWVYDNTKPGQNQYNIRLTSNSWGSGGDEQVYYKEDALTLLIEGLVYENNVAVVFAAGNDNGDGSTINTNPWSLVPASISVAATQRDGSGMASFSSRGKADLMASWPDIAAPGVDIWSTAARGTFIDAITKSQNDMYYLAISGTSMATPHVSGLVALLSQAAPSLRTSDTEEDNDGNFEWPSHERARIHETELILKLTAEPLPAGGEGVPTANWTGLEGRQIDFAQGYGLVNATRAVGVALTLQTMRDNGYSNANVFHAYERYMPTITSGYVEDITDRLGSAWRGEWSQLVDRSNPTNVYTTDQSHYLWIPEGAISADITFQFTQVDASTRTVTDLDLLLDADGDGQLDDLPPQNSYGGVKEYHVDIAQTGMEWLFGITGTGGTILDFFDDFPEARAKYTVGVTLNLADGANVTIDHFDRRPDRGHWQPTSASHTTVTTVALFRPTFDLTQIDFEGVPRDGEKEGEGLLDLLTSPWAFLMILIAIAAVAVFVGREWGRQEALDREAKAQETQADGPDDEVLDAEQ